MKRSSIVTVDHLDYAYPKKGILAKPNPLVLNNIHFTVAKGESLGIVGESGSGKSTIAKLLLGLIQPSKGSIYLNDTPMMQMPYIQKAKKIQMIFQDPYSSLNPMQTIDTIIRTGLNVHKIAVESEKNQRIEEICEAVGLPKSLLKAFPRELSGGQRQRVAIARALVLNPEVIVCDEPTSALDVSIQAQIINLLLELQQRFHLTYIFISHNLSVVYHLCDRAIVIEKGQIVEQNEMVEIYHQPQHAYTQRLVRSVLMPPAMNSTMRHL